MKFFDNICLAMCVALFLFCMYMAGRTDQVIQDKPRADCAAQSSSK